MTGKYVTQGRIIYYQPPGEPTEGRKLIGWASSTDDAGLICEELNRLITFKQSNANKEKNEEAALNRSDGG